jgi:hypothetical protein
MHPKDNDSFEVGWVIAGFVVLIGLLIAYETHSLSTILEDQATGIQEESPTCMITPHELPWARSEMNITAVGDDLWYCSDTHEDKNVFCMKLVPGADCKRIAYEERMAHRKHALEEARRWEAMQKAEKNDRKLRWGAMHDILDTLNEFRASSRKK